jgi:hypothetical protein
MIDYFVRPLQGVQAELTLDRLRAWKQKTGANRQRIVNIFPPAHR